VNDSRSPPRTAVLELGSNSLKALVLAGTGAGTRVLADESVECRITRGFYCEDPPRFTEPAMEEAIAALQRLHASVQRFQPHRVETVATSAFRDAANRTAFQDRIERATGQRPVILEGEEEARAIARGLEEEPDWEPGRPFTLSDLGGGSLEQVEGDGHRIVRVVSFDLGAVRLLERFHTQPEEAMPPQVRAGIRDYCREIFRSGFPEPHPHPHPHPTILHWGTGGAFTVLRLLLATEEGCGLLERSPVLTAGDIRTWSERLAGLSLAERARIPGLPEARADILPVALLILEALSEATRTERYHHSLCNLRFGRAAALLDGIGSARTAARPENS
jgi:exopolyphosphatase/guanosine-5'-triphosphate,3'-diphosphate pyrophosphatase